LVQAFLVRGRRCAFGILALPLLAFVAGCNNTAAHPPDKKPPEVEATPAITDEVADYKDFTGRLEGLKMVDIRARASGFILSAPFKEGDMVKQGDLLFEIDPTPYAADYNLAEANLTLARADENLQQKNAARARALIKTNAMAQEDCDTAVATWEKSRATVAAMAATRDRAKEYLSYTKVYAPWNGRISRRLVDPGNLVNADATVLTTLVQDDQLYATFDVDERTYLEIGGPTTPGEYKLSDRLQFPVLLRLANEEDFSRTGVVKIIDNRVVGNTGTIRMWAVVDNPDRKLRAGLFVRVRLPVGKPYRAVLIPDEAVLKDQDRKYVYVVGDSDTVAYRKVDLGQEIKGLRVVRDGLAEGERVMVVGMQRVRPGATAHVTMKDAKRPPDSPLRKLPGVNHPAAPARPDRPGTQAKGADARPAPVSAASGK
jgi:RND family efflux transporter MFP subunit